VSLLFLLWLGEGENGPKRCKNFSPTKISLERSYLVKRKLEICIIIFDAALIFEEELEVAAVADDLKRRSRCETLQE
jgi:hypothetical protein